MHVHVAKVFKTIHTAIANSRFDFYLFFHCHLCQTLTGTQVGSLLSLLYYLVCSRPALVL